MKFYPARKSHVHFSTAWATLRDRYTQVKLANYLPICCLGRSPDKCAKNLHWLGAICLLLCWTLIFRYNVESINFGLVDLFCEFFKRVIKPAAMKLFKTLPDFHTHSMIRWNSWLIDALDGTTSQREPESEFAQWLNRRAGLAPILRSPPRMTQQLESVWFLGAFLAWLRELFTDDFLGFSISWIYRKTFNRMTLQREGWKLEWHPLLEVLRYVIC
jgi:hypothetical protein